MDRNVRVRIVTRTKGRGTKRQGTKPAGRWRVCSLQILPASLPTASIARRQKFRPNNSNGASEKRNRPGKIGGRSLAGLAQKLRQRGRRKLLKFCYIGKVHIVKSLLKLVRRNLYLRTFSKQIYVDSAALPENL
jgi:hypothetical protein